MNDGVPCGGFTSNHTSIVCCEMVDSSCVELVRLLVVPDRYIRRAR